VLVVPGAVDVAWDPSRPVTPARRVWELSAASLRSLLPVAEGEGVTLALENVWNRFLTGPFEFASFIDQFASEHVRSYFDAGNAVLLGYPEHWIEILGPRIARVHVKGFRRNNGGGDMSGFTGSLLDADIDWSAVVAALAETGYEGWLTAEMMVSDQGLPDAALAGRVALEMDQIAGTKEKAS
jgi:L-ribulose-5-phosphate 3-epimerase